MYKSIVIITAGITLAVLIGASLLSYSLTVVAEKVDEAEIAMEQKIIQTVYETCVLGKDQHLMFTNTQTGEKWLCLKEGSTF
jgi:hypothetical protein